MDSPRVFVGFDPREAIAYHVFCQSLIEHASCPLAIHPLASNLLSNFDGQRDGTNAFIYSRFLVPELCGFSGWAIFVDGDMIVLDDIAKIMEFKDDSKAAVVVKRHYLTKHNRKYIGTKMESDNADYPKKNWSSVILWNCGHQSNRILTREFVSQAAGSFLHRFEWLNADELGELPQWWNYLVREEAPGKASLYHYTLGVPGIRHYADDYGSWHWHAALLKALACAGEDPNYIVKRAEERVGAI